MSHQIIFITRKSNTKSNISKISYNSIVMRFRLFVFFTHKKWSRFFDCFDKIIGTIRFFAGIHISSEIFGKQWLSTFFFGSKSNSQVGKPCFDTGIRIISISTFSFVSSSISRSKIICPIGGSSFKGRIIHKRSQSLVFSFRIVER